jgi:hypothetical protein
MSDQSPFAPSTSMLRAAQNVDPVEPENPFTWTHVGRGVEHFLNSPAGLMTSFLTGKGVAPAMLLGPGGRARLGLPPSMGGQGAPLPAPYSQFSERNMPIPGVREPGATERLRELLSSGKPVTMAEAFPKLAGSELDTAYPNLRDLQVEAHSIRNSGDKKLVHFRKGGSDNPGAPEAGKPNRMQVYLSEDPSGHQWNRAVNEAILTTEGEGSRMPKHVNSVSGRASADVIGKNVAWMDLIRKMLGRGGSMDKMAADAKLSNMEPSQRDAIKRAITAGPDELGRLADDMRQGTTPLTPFEFNKARRYGDPSVSYRGRVTQEEFDDIDRARLAFKSHSVPDEMVENAARNQTLADYGRPSDERPMPLLPEDKATIVPFQRWPDTKRLLERYPELRGVIE